MDIKYQQATSGVGSPQAIDCCGLKQCWGWYQDSFALSLGFFSQHLLHSPKHEAGLSSALNHGKGPNTHHAQDPILWSDCKHLLEILGIFPLD